MPKAFKIILITMIGLTIAATIFAVVYYGIQKSDSTVNEQTNTDTANTPVNTGNINAPATNQPVNTGENGGTNTPVENGEPQNGAAAEEQDDQAALLRLARVFVERYGSFSNQNDFENLINLESFMTERFWRQTEKYITETKKTQSDTDEYYGITTSALTLELQEYVEGDTATARVGTRRVETKGAADPAIFSQFVTVYVKSISGEWKVDAVTWE